MRFKHRVINKQYTVLPVDYEISGPHRKRTPGLLVRFANHYWDSLVAQQRNGWSDADRVMVENHLKNHRDFGREWSLGMGGLYFDETEHVPEAAPEGSAAPQEQAPLTSRCIFTIPLPDGAEQCKEDARTGSDYCNTHFAEMAKAKVAEARSA